MIENYYRNEKYMELFQHADADTIIKALENDPLLAKEVGYIYSLNGVAKMMVTSPLSIMCYRNDVEHTKLLNVIKLLIDNGADINFLDSTPLRNACFHVNIKVVTLLLEQKALLEYEAENYLNRYQPSGSILYDVCKSAYELKSSGLIPLYTKNGFIDYIEEENQKSKIIQKEKEIIKLLVKNGADVHFTYNDTSPFKYAYDKNDKEIVELFLKNKAREDSLYDKEITFLEHAGVYKKEKKWFLELLHKQYPHNPKELADILNKFSSSENLKYTNHIWDSNLKYNDFIKNFQTEWNEIKENLNILSQSLHDNIEKFLFEKKLGQNDAQGKSISWGKGITIGFSSPEIVEWVNRGNKPEQYLLPNRTKELKTFKDIMEEFKSMIVVKQNDKKLKLLKKFLDVKKDRNLEFDLFDLKDDKIDKFFTDVTKLEEALKIIFNDIETISEENKKVKVTVEEKTDFIEIQIIHLSSSSSKTAEQLLQTIDKNGGNFKSIYKNLTSVCDWHVDTICNDGNRYLIDYLYPKSDDNKPHYKQIGQTNEGFTHILRFYK